MIAGNWKMNGTPAEGASLARNLRSLCLDLPAVDVVVFPPALSIQPVLAELRHTDIVVGGQDLHPAASGAHTGNTSGEMLHAAGCRAVLVGHSERRSNEQESGAYLAAKVRAALRSGLQAVFCCGESGDERDANTTLEVVRGQLSDGLDGLTSSEMERIVIAYEPVWAIGTGRVATPQQAQDIHQAIRAWAGIQWGTGATRSLRILYGGSVKPGNVAGIMAQPDIDGALVGGASLTAQSFDAIIRFERNQ